MESDDKSDQLVELAPLKEIEIFAGDSKAENANKTQINEFRKKAVEMLKLRGDEITSYPSSLMVLNLEANRMTYEALKPIWALLEANPQLYISFDSPECIR